MDIKRLYGIQQIGIGVTNAEETFNWYAKHLGADVLIFDDKNDAVDMAPYMGGEPRSKRALLSFNMNGGSGYEIWQYTKRTPQPPEMAVQVGDLGINMIIIKSRDVAQSHAALSGKCGTWVSEIVQDPSGLSSFYMKDPGGNLIKIQGASSWYKKSGFHLGGICGAIIGVSDIEKALPLYKKILGYDTVVYDEVTQGDEWESVSGGQHKVRRVMLAASGDRSGGFYALFGDSCLELVQVLDRAPQKIFENRYWGDLGYIHICFDIRNMTALVAECLEDGFPFSILSNPSFEMGDTSGHFGYLEDPDGTLIEFVETFKVPLLKQLGWSINMKGRPAEKPLPNWLISALSLKRKKAM